MLLYLNMNKMKKRLAWENTLKNFLVFIVLGLAYAPMQHTMNFISEGNAANLLVIVSSLLVFVGFTGFTFTYFKNSPNLGWERFLAHSITFITMLLTASLMEFMLLVIKQIYSPFFTLFLAFTVVLYIGILLFDFWDCLKWNSV